MAQILLQGSVGLSAKRVVTNILKYINLSRLIHCSPYAGANLCHRVKHGTLIAVKLPGAALLSTLLAQGGIAACTEHFCLPVRMIFALHLDSFSGRWVFYFHNIISDTGKKGKPIDEPVFDA